MDEVVNELKKKQKSNLIKQHNDLLKEINELDRFIMNDTDFHYMTHARQILLKHKVVIMEINRYRLLQHLTNLSKST